MKTRIIIASFMMFFSISFCLGSLFITKNIHDNIVTNVEKIENCIIYADFENAKFNITKLKENWGNQLKIFSCFINQASIKTCDESIHTIESYIIAEDYLSCLIICDNLKTQIEQIYFSEQINLWNIL